MTISQIMVKINVIKVTSCTIMLLKGKSKDTLFSPKAY